MKAYFVVIFNGDSGYSMIEEVNGNGVEEFAQIIECALAGIKAFDKEKISGEPRTREELILGTANQCIEKDYSWENLHKMPYLSGYFDSKQSEATLIYIDEEGNHCKNDITEIIENYFCDMKKDIEAKIEELTKSKRHEEYEKLREEFEGA